jgi:hypothetical protein
LKTFLTCLTTAAVVLLGVTAFANAGQQSVTPAQFIALSKRVAKLEKANKAELTYIAACFNKWQPVSDYGPGDKEGYLYSFPDGTVVPTSALDLTNTGDTPNFFVPSPASDCSLNVARFRALAGHGRTSPAVSISPISRH